MSGMLNCIHTHQNALAHATFYYTERGAERERENVRFIYRLNFAQVRVIKSVFTVCTSA